MAGVFHRVEVIEIAEELVEAVHRRQELVVVAEVVLAELAGGVAHRLERRRDGHRLRRHADRRAGLADRGHAGADRQLAGDEVGAARRAARLGVVVGEQHALGGDLVEVRRPARHHAAVVGADVPDADVVAHDDDDVGLRLRGRRAGAPGERGQDGDQNPYGSPHDVLHATGGDSNVTRPAETGHSRRADLATGGGRDAHRG